MKSSQYLVIVMLCIAVCMGVAGCLQQVPPGNNTNQTCTTGTCPTPAGCSNATGTCPGVIQNITSYDECVAAGYPVMESYPRQCRVPGGPTFVENISRLCKEAGGNWNECSNRCRIDNAGNPDAVCTMMCEPLCECGGFAGFRCPQGYTCKTPAGIADALGYCIPKSGGNLTKDQAYALARNSTCVQEGNLTDNAFYNPNSRTWWIDLVPNTLHPGCNPACVIHEETNATEINWRCTGLVPPLNPDIEKNITCSAPTGEKMALANALQIASSGACAPAGTLTDRHTCNDITGTWWIDLEPFAPKQGCNPACVVDVRNGASEVNWRCTGLLPP